MFMSQSLTEHLIRGVGGWACIALALWLAPTSLWALLLLPLALVFFRGCPMCWTIGLFETLRHRLRGQAQADRAQFCTACEVKRDSEERYGP